MEQMCVETPESASRLRALNVRYLETQALLAQVRQQRERMTTVVLPPSRPAELVDAP